MSHVWDVIDERNNHLYLREVDNDGTSLHRLIDLDHGNYNLGILAFEIERQFNLNTRLTDGQWTVTSADRGRLTISQSSPTFQSARLYSGADVRGARSVPTNWLFPSTTG